MPVSLTTSYIILIYTPGLKYSITFIPGKARLCQQSHIFYKLISFFGYLPGVSLGESSVRKLSYLLKMVRAETVRENSV